MMKEHGSAKAAMRAKAALSNKCVIFSEEKQVHIPMTIMVRRRAEKKSRGEVKAKEGTLKNLPLGRVIRRRPLGKRILKERKENEKKEKQNSVMSIAMVNLLYADQRVASTGER